MDRQEAVTQVVNEKVNHIKFIARHKSCLSAFTRKRTLTFPIIFIIILRKSIKSLQISLNELLMQGYINQAPSASAYTQARKKFKHTAFIELNEDIISIYYSRGPIKRWQGYRCLAVDGSKILLPYTPEVISAYGETRVKNQHIEGSYSSAMFSCCYDVLNHIAVKSRLSSGNCYEVDQAYQMLEGMREKDLLIYDRGYVSYQFIAALLKANKSFIIRCSGNRFKATAGLFNLEGGWSQRLHLKAPRDKRRICKEAGLPLEIEVRFVRVVLSTGEVEILVTSLNDRELTQENFHYLYGLRWGVESFYFIIKSRLCLENFTGKTVESIKQDFWSTIFISNCETVMTEDVVEDAPLTQNRYQVNKAVSFNVIKTMAIDIFFNEKDKEVTKKKLKYLFKKSLVLKRPDRSPPRKKPSARRSYNFFRRAKKMVF